LLAKSSEINTRSTEMRKQTAVCLRKIPLGVRDLLKRESDQAFWESKLRFACGKYQNAKAIRHFEKTICHFAY